MPQNLKQIQSTEYHKINKNLKQIQSTEYQKFKHIHSNSNTKI